MPNTSSFLTAYLYKHKDKTTLLLINYKHVKLIRKYLQLTDNEVTTNMLIYAEILECLIQAKLLYDYMPKN
jgi:hypothetical protein